VKEVDLEKFSTLFWDFDGVIKESVDVKTRAYERLFEQFGSDVAARVRLHHENHGGMSRFEKLPLYLGWAAQPTTEEAVGRYCALFSTEVKQAVIDSDWVPGAREYLQANCRRQRLVLVTATPQVEIQEILDVLGIRSCFSDVFGAPRSKTNAVAAVLSTYDCSRDDCMLIGDSQADYMAAELNGVKFLLRRTVLNRSLQDAHAGPQCEDFMRWIELPQ
jgi:phosphoglycolate phosphatase-like HAD superfamily hydrolase